MKIIACVLLLVLFNCAAAETRTWKVRQTSDTDLFWTPNRIHGLTVTFSTTGPADLTTAGHLNLKHRCFPGVGPVGYGVSIYYRYVPASVGSDPVIVKAALDVAPKVWLATSSGNVRDCAHHYMDAGLESYERLIAPGWYRTEVWAGSHSSDAWGVDGLLEVNNEGNGQVNQMIVRVEDAQ